MICLRTINGNWVGMCTGLQVLHSWLQVCTLHAWSVCALWMAADLVCALDYKCCCTLGCKLLSVRTMNGSWVDMCTGLQVLLHSGLQVAVCAHYEWQLSRYVHWTTCVVALWVASLHISRVSDQNGVSLLYIMLEIHHHGREPLIWSVCALWTAAD